MPQSTIPIYGNSLTCFTSAIATYLSHYGIDYVFAFGLQLYLALKFEEQDGPQASFIYFRRPLTNDSPLYTFHATRCQTGDHNTAYKRLNEEWQHQKQVIIVGDAYNLPWHINHNKKHTIHWFVVENIDEIAQKARVHDPFELVDVHGTQVPYDGWVPLSVLVDLAKVHENPSYPYFSRDLHGFGNEEHFPLTDYHGYQWFEANATSKLQNIPRTYFIQELTDTYLHMTGEAQRKDLACNNWLLGMDAVAQLPALFRKHLTNPMLYEMRDDFWGVSRHHQLFAYALHRMAQETGELHLEDFARWCEETLVPLWSAIPRLMLYNASCLEQQRPPRAILIEQAEKVYQAELECIQKLGEHLSHIREALSTAKSVDQKTLVSGKFVAPTANALVADREDKASALPNGSTVSPAQTNAASLSSIEKVTREIWGSILGVEHIGVYDDFFSVGGDSLKATQILSRLYATFRVEVSLLTFLEKPTIAELSRFIEEKLLHDKTEECWSQIPASHMAQSGVQKVALSFAQERQWILNQLEPSNPFYNIPVLLPLPEWVNASFLEQGLQTIVSRHATLRTTLALCDGVPMQVIAPPSTASLQRLKVVPLSTDENEIMSHIYEEARRPFDLATGPLFRATLFLPKGRDALFLFNVHHSIFDGWSIDILLRELAQCYQALARGEEVHLAPLPIQYSDFSTWQRRWFQEAGLEAHMAYWSEHLQQAPATSQFPMDYPRPASQTYHGANFLKSFNKDLLNQLYAMCYRENVTLFMALLATFQTLLFRYTYQEDIVIGTPIANRTRVETEPLIGFFVNTLPLRVTLHEKLTFKQLLRQVRAVTSQAYAHQDIPFEKMLEVLKLERSLSISPLFQILFVLQNTPLSTNYEIEGRALSPQVLANGTTEFELVLAFSIDAQTLSLNVQYNTALFREETIRQIIQHYQIILESVVKQPDTCLDALPLMGPEEQQQMLDDTYKTTREYPSKPACVHELFERCVERNPQTIALCKGTSMLTYSELNRRANQLAHYLKEQGIRAEDVVGLCAEHSFEMVIGLLAILKAGGAFAPIDVSQPRERLVQIIKRVNMRLLLTSSSTVPALPPEISPLCVLDQIDDLSARYSSDNPRPSVVVDNLCYVVHTSGSTGTPKGIAMTHRPLMNLLYWHKELAENTRITNTAQFAAPIFDTFFLELFLTFLRGGTLKLLPEEGRNDPEQLLLYLRQEAIERIFMPFAALQPLALVAQRVGSEPLPLREIITGGEQLHATQELRWWLHQMPACRLWNTYGPSETHEVTTLELASDPGQWPMLPPIGHTIANTQIYVLDKQLRPVPPFVEGELYIGGICLSRGYVDQPDTTAESFIPNPFSSAGERFYRTGDCGRYLPGGILEFTGRRDTQIKIRGYRVELGEVEAVLRQHAMVQDCVVSAVGKWEQKRILAYIIPDQASPELPEQLHAYMSSHLPTYMCPTSYIVLESFPLSATGKIDRRALDATYSNASTLRVKRKVVHPRNEVEQSLAKIWCDMLHLEEIDIYENFFALGGHSLLAIQLALRIRKEMEIDVKLQSLFEYPTIAQLAEFIITREIAEADEKLIAALLQELGNT